jgi:2-C-methyl-D-erythritol 4-phosphate cytidylyltransferase
MKVSVIIPAAGEGIRMRLNQPKLFIKIKNREMICYSLEVFEKIPCVSEIIIAAKAEHFKRLDALIKRQGFAKPINIVTGAKNRAESVLNALYSVDRAADLILVHDCARPLICCDIVKKTVKKAVEKGSAIAAVRVKPTIKKVCGKGLYVAATLDRQGLWEAQTPQVFQADTLKAAYKRAGKRAGFFTDESSLVESLGKKVAVVESSYENIKITTQEDIAIAQAFLGLR